MLILFQRRPWNYGKLWEEMGEGDDIYKFANFSEQYYERKPKIDSRENFQSTIYFF